MGGGQSLAEEDNKQFRIWVNTSEGVKVLAFLVFSSTGN